MKGQVQTRNGISSDLQIENSVLSDTETYSQGVAPVSNVNTTPQMQPWKDPQIYLSSAANGKSASSHYDIVDFVSGNVEEKIIVGGSGSHQVVVKSGSKKPKLENVSLAQWTVANLAILYKLKGEAKLTGEGFFDYLSYTTKVCQLIQRYNLVSVLLYDREYRNSNGVMNLDGAQMCLICTQYICNPVYHAKEMWPQREEIPKGLSQLIPL